MSLSAGSTISRASSGSSGSISSIEPLMSANNAVTVLRSPSAFSGADDSATRIAESPDSFAGAALASGSNAAPQSSQNFAEGELSAPHFAQRLESRVPHSAQNFLPLVLSVPHLEQRILIAQLVEQGLRLFQIARVETFSEPVVDRGEHRTALFATNRVAQQPREAGGSP